MTETAGAVLVDPTITCYGMPLQIEATLEDGRHIYFRARWDHIRLGVGPTPEDAIAGGPEDVHLSIDGLGKYAAGSLPPELGLSLAEWLASCLVG